MRVGVYPEINEDACFEKRISINEKRHPESSGHLLSTMKTKYYFLAKKSLTVDESITASLNV